MTQETPLNEGKDGRLNSAGTGTVTLGVGSLFRWHVTRIAVLTATNVLEPVAKVYVDSVSPVNFLAGTYTGSNDSSDENLWLRPGQKLICEWTGGDANAVATLSVFGTKIS